MSIDIHTHAFHPKVADKVLAQLHSHYDICPVGTGLVEDLKQRLQAACLDRAVVLTAATSADQVIPANNWAISLQQEPELEAFGTLHPDYRFWEKELNRLEAAGVKGLKFHPDFQGFWLNDPALGPMWESIGDRFLIMLHVGDRVPPAQNPSCPAKLSWLMQNFPYLKIVAAHLGGVFQWSHAIEHIIGKDIYLDTSSCLDFIKNEELQYILQKHSKEKLLFGSDYPLFDPASELAGWEKRAKVSSSWLQDLVDNGDKLLA